MKNNYDLILNFETNDGEPLSEEIIDNMLSFAIYMAKILEAYDNITVWKAVISQAVDSRRVQSSTPKVIK